MLRINLSAKQANESRHFSLHVIHESVPRWGRQDADSTGNQFLNQKIAVSSDGMQRLLCFSKVYNRWQTSFIQTPQENHELFKLHLFLNADRLSEKVLCISLLTGWKMALFSNLWPIVSLWKGLPLLFSWPVVISFHPICSSHPTAVNLAN